VKKQFVMSLLYSATTGDLTALRRFHMQVRLLYTVYTLHLLGFQNALLRSGTIRVCDKNYIFMVDGVVFIKLFPPI
jgi:hypothetical protein